MVDLFILLTLLNPNCYNQRSKNYPIEESDKIYLRKKDISLMYTCTNKYWNYKKKHCKVQLKDGRELDVREKCEEVYFQIQ